jgi:hypothetical protein
VRSLARKEGKMRTGNITGADEVLRKIEKLARKLGDPSPRFCRRKLLRKTAGMDTPGGQWGIFLVCVIKQHAGKMTSF